MGVWGYYSDQNDGVADAEIELRERAGLYADPEEGEPLEGQALADARDAALLDPSAWEDVRDGHVAGLVVAMLREGYRVDGAAIGRARAALRFNLKHVGLDWSGDQRAARVKAIAHEQVLLNEAEGNDGLLSEASRAKYPSAGLLETMAADVIQDGETGEGDAAATRPASPPPPPLPEPFAWLDAAPLKKLARAATKVGLSHRGHGLERKEIISAIKKHPRRAHVRAVLAPY